MSHVFYSCGYLPRSTRVNRHLNKCESHCFEWISRETGDIYEWSLTSRCGTLPAHSEMLFLLICRELGRYANPRHQHQQTSPNDLHPKPAKRKVLLWDCFVWSRNYWRCATKARSFLHSLFICEMPQSRDYLWSTNTSIWILRVAFSLGLLCLLFRWLVAKF